MVFILITFYGVISAQQLPKWSTFYENGFIWNPALTAQWYSWEASITHRRDWSGFDVAPEYSTIGFQVPLSDSYFRSKASLGGFIQRDKLGPYDKIGVAGTYSYKITPQLFNNRKDVLSLGLMVEANRYGIDQNRIITFDQTGSIDGLASSFQPNVTLGFFYRSNTYLYNREDHYFFGASINRLVPFSFGDVGLNNFDNDVYSTVHAGWRTFMTRQFYLEPNFLMVYGYQKAVDAMFSIRGEIFEKFWFGTGVSTTGEVFGQAGVVFDGRSVLGGLVGDGALRMGIKSDYRLGSIRNFAGRGYELYVSYQYEIE